MYVAAEVLSANRTLKPTSRPSGRPSSSATRAAIERAAAGGVDEDPIAEFFAPQDDPFGMSPRDAGELAPVLHQSPCELTDRLQEDIAIACPGEERHVGKLVERWNHVIQVEDVGRSPDVNAAAKHPQPAERFLLSLGQQPIAPVEGPEQ